MSDKVHESFGPYVLYEPIARGGMATVHAARLVGAEGFSRLVAAKRLHGQYADDPEFVAMLHDEARIASKIHHPNVVPVLDVVVQGGEVLVVQDYVHGVALHTLMRAANNREMPIPSRVIVAIVTGILAGLHAAHEARDEMGMHLGIVHRDVSPQNVMVSVDGIPRLLDFGIAKAKNQSQHTRQGFLKGKVGYMAAEQMRCEPITRRADLYAVGVLLWELLTNRRYFTREDEAAFISRVLSGQIEPMVDALEPARTPEEAGRREEVKRIEPIVLRAMARAPEDRYATAVEMIEDLLAVCPAASSFEVAAWVKSMGTEDLDRRQKMLAANEQSWRSSSKIAAASEASASRYSPNTSLTPSRAVAVASIRVDDAPPATPTRRRSRLMPLAAAVLLGGLAAVGLLTLVKRDRVVVVPMGAEASSPPALMPGAAAIAPPPPVVDTLPVAPDAAASVAAAPTQTQAPRPVRAWRPPPPPPAAPPPQAAPARDPAADCNPPFYYSGSRKVFKPGCI